MENGSRLGKFDSRHRVSLKFTQYKLAKEYFYAYHM
jgi:hypothetical protein